MPVAFHDLLDDASSEDSDVGPGLRSEAHPPRECLMTELVDHNTALPLPATAGTPPDLMLAHTTRISLIHDSRIPSQVDEKNSRSGIHDVPKIHHVLRIIVCLTHVTVKHQRFLSVMVVLKG